MPEAKVRNIGIPNVEPPEKVCDDPHCPFHGNLPVRGRVMEGTVTSTKMHKTITFQHAHLPPCIDVSVGDAVKVVECRPLSKTVTCVVVSATRLTVSEEE
jgi:small subunit ribosomal protein S17